MIGSGFGRRPRRTRYYTQPDEDAVLMEMAPLQLGMLCEPPVESTAGAE